MNEIGYKIRKVGKYAYHLMFTHINEELRGNVSYECETIKCDIFSTGSPYMHYAGDGRKCLHVPGTDKSLDNAVVPLESVELITVILALQEYNTRKR